MYHIKNEKSPTKKIVVTIKALIKMLTVDSHRCTVALHYQLTLISQTHILGNHRSIDILEEHNTLVSFIASDLNA